MKMVRIADFPNCCTAYIIHDFGNTRQAFKDNTKYTIKETIANIEQAIIDMPNIKADYCGLIIAITNSEQIVVHKALQKIGFKRVKQDFKKHRHRETTLQLWFWNKQGGNYE